MTEIDWFVGSNGNQFADSEDFRYCIHPSTNAGPNEVVRNGETIATGLTMAEARRFIECQAASNGEEL